MLATACRVGAVVGGLPRPTIESLTEFGLAYGMAYQVVPEPSSLALGISAVGNYRAQFHWMLKNKTPSQVIEILEERIRRLESDV